MSEPFTLAVDASDLGVGAVLMQKDSEVDHPVSYFSKKFDKHQKGWSTIEKEAFGLISALKHFSVYLSTSSFPILVLTDHNPLVFMEKMKDKNMRILRWSLIVQDYNISIKHVRGVDNVIADCLSRPAQE